MPLFRNIVIRSAHRGRFRITLIEADASDHEYIRTFRNNEMIS